MQQATMTTYRVFWFMAYKLCSSIWFTGYFRVTHFQLFPCLEIYRFTYIGVCVSVGELSSVQLTGYLIVMHFCLSRESCFVLIFLPALFSPCSARGTVNGARDLKIGRICVFAGSSYEWRPTRRMSVEALRLKLFAKSWSTAKATKRASCFPSASTSPSPSPSPSISTLTSTSSRRCCCSESIVDCPI